jgi:hypothetical protein
MNKTMFLKKGSSAGGGRRSAVGGKPNGLDHE